jgi:hypothetical protein
MHDAEPPLGAIPTPIKILFLVLVATILAFAMRQVGGAAEPSAVTATPPFGG